MNKKTLSFCVLTYCALIFFLASGPQAAAESPPSDTQVLLQGSELLPEAANAFKIATDSLNHLGEDTAMGGTTRVRIREVTSLPDGQLSRLIPVIETDGSLTVEFQATREALSSAVRMKEALLHLKQIFSVGFSFANGQFSGIWYNLINESGKRFPFYLMWAEKTLNAQAGSKQAQYDLALAEQEAAEELVLNALDKEDPELITYAKNRLAETQKIVQQAKKSAREDLKTRTALWAKQKANQKELDRAQIQLDDLIAKNDRKGVVKLIRRYLPEPLMEPSEVKAWNDWLNAIETPSKNPDDKLLLYRGINSDLVRDSADKKSRFLMSTLLTKARFSYNSRLRRLESHHTSFGLPAGIKEGSTSLIGAMINHAQDPVASPFLSLTSDPGAASRFGPPAAIIAINRKRVLLNPASLSDEMEVLAPLILFPDEVVSIESKLEKPRLEQLKAMNLGKTLPDDQRQWFRQARTEYLRGLSQISALPKASGGCIGIYEGLSSKPVSP